VIATAVNDHPARVLSRLPEPRRFGTAGFPGVLAMVLLALVLFLGGLVVGRASMTRSTPATAAPTTTAASAETSTPPAVAATPGTAAAPAQASGAAVGRVGPKRVQHGVGVGWARTQHGAVAAAANYTKVLSSTLILDQAKRRLAIGTLAAPEAASQLQKTFDQAVASLVKGLGVTAGAGDGTARVLLRAVPVGWRVEQYGGDTAKVAIWVTSVGGSLGGAQGPVPVREGWGTTTVTLRWAGGDWKQVASTTAEGPVPIADVAPPTAAAELVDKANEFKEFNYAPGS
jgi:hypothetical protein